MIHKHDKGNDATTAAHHVSSATCQLVASFGEGIITVALPPSGSIVLGRGDIADVILPHVSVSRRHAALHFGVSTFEIEDLGSANGTRVDGVVVGRGRKATVVLGAIVELGAVRVLLRSAYDEGDAPSPMARVRAMAERFAPSDISIILTGETGVGKEVLADAIHARSPRAGGPFVRINCAALAPNLLESELFGYERAAFTGALRAKQGLIESATGGTLFLDELGEMPAVTQPKLLRVLESREVRPVGALKPRPVDVRFIAATNRDLAVLAVMGQFRQDLLFRLNGVTIQIPPLRERRAEIRPLSASLVTAACQRAGKATVSISEEALVILESYRWPGNVRELGHVIARAVHLCDDGAIEIQHLLFDTAAVLGRGPPPSSPPQTPSIASPPSPLPPHDASDPERDRILAALAACGGNQAAAAKRLGLTRRVLSNRLDKFGVRRPRKGGAGGTDSN
ncbi:MAG: hypothetical protein NVSMB1_13610 [Polyangiales bacterium]